MKKLRVVCIVLMLLCSIGATDAACHFIHYNKENSGLPYNGIRTMKQDSRGYVWIGTHKGLSRYDGFQFKNYDRYDFGVESDYICALEEDETGNIWIGTDNGVIIYEYASDSFHLLGEWLGTENFNDRIFSIEADSRGNMWIGTRSSGLFRCDLRRKELQNVAITDEKSNPVVNLYKIAMDRRDQPWIAVYCDNIYRLDRGSDVLTKVLVGANADYFRNDDVEGLLLDDYSDDLLYVASKKHGLCQVDVKTGTVRNLLLLSEGHRPTNLSKSNGRYLWLSSTEGLFRYDLQSGEVLAFRNDPEDRFSLSDNYVTTTFIDKRDGLWVGTLNGGVNYYGSFQNGFKKFYKTEDGRSLEGCIVRSFAEDNSGNVWIATEQAGLLKLDLKENALYKYASSRIPRSITAVCDDGAFLWIGMQNGISRLSLRNGRIVSYTLPGSNAWVSDNRIVSIFRSSENIVYAATAVGVLKYKRDEDRFVPIDKLENLTIEHMVEDAYGKIWMASYSDGIFVYDPVAETLIHYCTRNGNSLIPEMTSSMCVDGEGGIWTIGFSAGIFRYDRETDSFSVVNRSVLPALPTDVYFSAASDRSGNIWLSSDSGLVKYNPDNGLIKVFTIDDGLLDTDFKKSVLTLSDGQLLFGSENGFICFDPDSFEPEPMQIRVLISDMTVGGVSRSPGDGRFLNIDIAEELCLAPRENSFGFSFSTPDVPTPAYGRLLCRLEGYDASWRDVSTTKEVEYYNVPAGKYSLRIKTIGYDGSSLDAHKALRIVVEPKFWESPEGIFLFVFILLLVVSLIARYLYMKALDKERRKQEAYEKARDAELYEEKITFFSNIVHEIKTPLTLIKTPLQQILSNDKLGKEVVDDLEVIGNSTEYLDRLVRELLDFIRIEKHGYHLNLETIDIVEKLGFLCFNFAETAKAKNVRLQYRHDEDCIYIEADESALTKMLNNLLHNAVKYAESSIDVHVYQGNDQVTVTIRNDGPRIPDEHREDIFKPFVSYADDDRKYAQSFGIGLSLAKTFAEMHHGVLFLDSDPDVTKFVLRMPARVGEKAEYRSPEMNMDDYVRSSDKPLIVLAEDNKDLSSYLKRKLTEEFRVITVPSAERTLALLKKYDVDLLITDIALQNMNGVELCKRVSSDFEISHIPVVVVSAISSIETKIECMDSGAAIYIEKPFSLDYLLSCIRNILDKRMAIRNAVRANDMDRMDMNRFDLPDMDEEFLRRLDKVILENLENPNFSNKQLEEKLFLSYSTLNRKVRALFDMTPNDYLRKKRLSVAAHLLVSGGSRINEICHAVGFTSPSYFSKCFKEQYGLLPMEYRAEFSRKE